MTLNPKEKKQLRAIGHKLKPLVTIAGKGITEGVQLEIERALHDHELIKIKVVVGDRILRQQVIGQVCADSNSELVQSIGNTALLLKRAKNPDPKLSNLLRNLSTI